MYIIFTDPTWADLYLFLTMTAAHIKDIINLRSLYFISAYPRFSELNLKGTAWHGRGGDQKDIGGGGGWGLTAVSLC